MTDSTTPLEDVEFMDALLNFLIPPDTSTNLPGAGALALSPEIAAGLDTDPMLGPLVKMALAPLYEASSASHPQGLAGMAPEAAQELVASHFSAQPFLVMGLLRYACPVYYQHPDVLAGMGHEPRPPFPGGYTIESTDPALLERLQARARRD